MPRHWHRRATRRLLSWTRELRRARQPGRAAVSGAAEHAEEEAGPVPPDRCGRPRASDGGAARRRRPRRREDDEQGRHRREPAPKSIDSLGQSSQVTALEQERQTIIAMNDAAETLTVASKPAQADPTSILAAEQAANSSSSNSGIQTGTGITGSAPRPTRRRPCRSARRVRRLRVQQGDPVDLPVRPVAAGERLERLRGEPVRCLRHPAVAARGQDGFRSGSDWQTNPRTQIIWGLGYIKSVYGTPCAAWANE